MQDCIFCKIIAGEIPSVKVYEDDLVFAFMDINPLQTGHTLIIPKVHAENLWEIPESDLNAVHAASQKIVNAMNSALGPVSVAVFQLNGRAVNQVLMHYHLHLIPRANTEGPFKLTAWEMIPGDMDAIQKTGAAIAAAIS